MSTEHDAEGRHIGAEVAQLFQPWCEACGWFGPSTFDRTMATTNAQLHDEATHTPVDNPEHEHLS